MNDATALGRAYTFAQLLGGTVLAKRFDSLSVQIDLADVERIVDAKRIQVSQVS